MCFVKAKHCLTLLWSVRPSIHWPTILLWNTIHITLSICVYQTILHSRVRFSIR